MNNNDILKSLIENKKEIKDFANVLNLSNHLDRNLSIGYIDTEVGEAVENLIRFWNKIDDEKETQYLLNNNSKPFLFKREPIKIYINSEGGSLLATFTMIDAIKMSKTPVYCINTGMAYSGGFLTFIAGHKRFAYPHSSFLFHEGNIKLGDLDAGKFRNGADFYKRQLGLLKDIVLKNTKITEEEYEIQQKDDVWYLANEALEKGICDEIIEGFI